jgi:hypothetical protein
MMGRVDASMGRHDVSCWHEREVFPCPLCRRSWSISGRNADAPAGGAATARMLRRHGVSNPFREQIRELAPVTSKIARLSSNQRPLLNVMSECRTSSMLVERVS